LTNPCVVTVLDYKEYASSHYSGLWTAPAIALMSSAMVRAYCHKVIKLSAVLQTYAPEKEAISNVHGVREDFLREGIRRAELGGSGSYSEHGAGEVHAYFIGKLLWAKGLDIMLELEDYYKQCTGEYFPIDVFGSGPDQKDIMRAFHGRRKKLLTAAAGENATDSTDDAAGEAGSGDLSSSESDDLSEDSDASQEDSSSSLSTSFASFTFFSSSRIHKKAKQKLARFKEKFDAVELPKTFHELRRKPIPAKFPGRVDHAEVKDYKAFVNPSISEVLCTTTAEALAMGKFAIIPVHPSNTFFLKFPNCLAYRNKFEFVANLRWALTHEPEPLTDELAREFTWEAATERFLAASSITYEEAARRERLGLTKLDERIAWFHNEIGKGATGDMLRKIFGAGPAAHQSRYDAERQQKAGGIQDEEEDDDDGLSRKFRRSSFAEALRATVADLGSFIQ
jgi:digalactosyldiacylglycerol synthase